MGSDAWLWPAIKDHFFGDIEVLHESAGPWDLILFTGDLTQRAAKAEFDALSATLEQILAKLRALGSRPLLLAIPGNHDLQRPAPILPEVRALSGWHGDRELREAFWSGNGATYRAFVEQVFAPFTDWYDAWTVSHPPPPALHVDRVKGMLPGDFAATVAKGDLRLGLIGLNSAFLQLTGANFKAKLDLDPRQLAALKPDVPAWLKEHHATVLMTHHPVDWLHKRARDRYRTILAPPGHFTAHLFGHMHEARTGASSIDGFATMRQIQAASLFGLETWGTHQQRIHGYSAGRIEVEQKVGTLRLWPRAMRKVQAGFFDVAANSDFKLDRTSAMALPFEPHVALRPEEPAPSVFQPPGEPYDAYWYVARERQQEDALD